MKNEVRQFIRDNFLFGVQVGEFSDDDSLLEKGIIDSTGVLELVGFLEETYGVRVHDQDLIPDNLDSVNRIVRYLENTLASRAVS